MSNLAEFLLARIAEDEEAAREANGRVAWLTFRYSDGSMRYTTVAHQLPESDVWVANGTAVDPSSIWTFYDTARVLAECEAKRRIVEEHAPYSARCQTCGGIDYPVEWPCPTVRLLALPYANHPEYREEWRP